jgi:hypothetical protein
MIARPPGTTERAELGPDAGSMDRAIEGREPAAVKQDHRETLNTASRILSLTA